MGSSPIGRANKNRHLLHLAQGRNKDQAFPYKDRQVRGWPLPHPSPKRSFLLSPGILSVLPLIAELPAPTSAVTFHIGSGLGD
jgi:hypothetical protein